MWNKMNVKINVIYSEVLYICDNILLNLERKSLTVKISKTELN